MGVSFKPQKNMKLFGLMVVSSVVFASIGVEAKSTAHSVMAKAYVSLREQCAVQGEECKTNGRDCCEPLWCNGAADQHYCEDDSCSRYGEECNTNGKACCQGFMCRNDGARHFCWYSVSCKNLPTSLALIKIMLA